MRTRIKTYYPEDFNPPSRYNLHTAIWLAKKSLDVSEVIIVVGKNKDGEISQEAKLEIWDIYLRGSVGAPIRVIKSENLSPLSHIYREQENNLEEPFCVALDEETANDERFKSYFEAFPNYEVIITPPYHKEDLVSLAQEDNIKKFNSFLPTELTKEDKKIILGLVKGAEQEPVDEVLTRGYWKNAISNILEKAGIK